MTQLGDLEKILSAAKEIGENLQKQLDGIREENDLLKIELEELRDENKILREENEKIYLEMNSLRNAKEEIRTANEAFSNNMNHLVTQLEDNHQKTMAQINQLLTGGLQNFIVDYMKKFRPVENIPVDETAEEKVSDEKPTETKNADEVTEVETLDKYSDTNDEVIVEDVETAVATRDGAKKNKMQYAAFYAEEAEVEKDDAGNAIKMKNLVRSHR